MLGGGALRHICAQKQLGNQVIKSFQDISRPCKIFTSCSLISWQIEKRNLTTNKKKRSILKGEKKKDKKNKNRSTTDKSDKLEQRSIESLGERIVKQEIKYSIGVFTKRNIETPIFDKSVLENWKDNKINSKYYNLHPNLSELVLRWKLPYSVNRTLFSVIENPTLIVRECILELIDLISNGPLSQTLVLRGQSGSGKTSGLLLLVTYLLNDNNIVLYIPDIKQYIDGRYYYDRSLNTPNAYDQHRVSQDILNKFIQINGKKLKLVNDKSSNALSLCEEGIKNLDKATDNLGKILNMIPTYNNTDNTKIYVVLDQMDRLFSLSKYKDHKDRILVSNFTYAIDLIPLITGEKKLLKGSVISSVESLDHKFEFPIFTALDFFECASFYDIRLRNKLDMDACSRVLGLLKPSISENLLSVMNINTKPSILQLPNQSIVKSSIFEKMDLKTFCFPQFTLEDIRSLISLYSECRLIPKSYDYNDSFVSKHQLVTNGSGHDLFKFITQL